MIPTIHPRLVPAVAAAAAGAVLLAACGGNKPTGTNAGSNNSPNSGISAAYKYSRCMRQHGVSNFPDPHVVQSANHVEVGIRVTPGLTGSPAFKSAQTACQGIIPGPNSAQSVAQRAAHTRGLISFARCMRAHQVQSFPDPTQQGQITPAMLSAAGINLKAPAVRAAALACVPASEGQLTKAQIEQALGPQ